MSNVIWKKITPAIEKKYREDLVLKQAAASCFKYEQLIYSVYRVMQTAFQFFIGAGVFCLAAKWRASALSRTVFWRKGAWCEVQGVYFQPPWPGDSSCWA